MLKRYNWMLDAVVSLRLREDLFTLAQTRTNCLMQFFDVRSDDGRWSDIDLNIVNPLFCVYAADNRLKPLFDAVIPNTAAKPNRRPLPRLMLSAMPVLDQKYPCSVSLVELTEKFESVGARVVGADLVPPKDSADLYAYELTGMWGSPEKLAKRLIRYFDTGVNWDDSKAFIFGEDLPPPRPIGG